MRVMVTGANGVIGRALVNRLLANGSIRGRPIEALLLFDHTLSGFPEDHRLRRHLANINDAALLRRALADGVDVVFHLEGAPGGSAKVQYDLGYEINLLGSLELMQQLRFLKHPAVLVYASSVEMYANDRAARTKGAQTVQAQSSYEAHQMMVEIKLSDLSRRGEIDGRAIRLPVIVGRAGAGYGDRSAFMSELPHACRRGEAYGCPSSPEVSIGWMSERCCIDNLLNAASIDDLTSQRVWQLPALYLPIRKVLDALVTHGGTKARASITFTPAETLDNGLGQSTRVKTQGARVLGFHHDGSMATMISNALELKPASNVRASARKLARG